MTKDMERLARALAEEAHPRITKERRAAALARLAEERAKHMMIDFGRGPEPVATGEIRLDDAMAESGYAVVPRGYDRFGWPKGHPDSPATGGA